jgi:DNA polymerase III subunit epsilon
MNKKWIAEMDMAYILDTETTGLIENRLRKLERQSEVIEYYGCLADLDTGKVVSEFETLIKPKTKISDKKVKGEKTISDITGITNDMLATAPIFADVAEQIRQHIEAAPLVLAHNAAFDREMLDIEMERCGKSIFWPHVLCTIEQTMHLKGFRLSLTNLHKHLFDEDFPEAHRAKSDVMALLRCCVELRKQGAI